MNDYLNEVTSVINTKELERPSSTKVEPMREIPALLEEQEKTISSLRKTCDYLHQKLGPALSSLDVDGAKDNSSLLMARPSKTEYGNSIRANTESIEETISHLRELIERLEL